MNTIFKYNAKVFDQRFKSGYSSNNFSLLNIYLDEKGPSVKIQLPNIFKDRHIVAKPSPATVGYDEGSLWNALGTKFYNDHGKYKPELSEYFHMYRCQLNLLCFVPQVHLVSLGNTSTIQICLYLPFIDSMYIFMYD